LLSLSYSAPFQALGKISRGFSPWADEQAVALPRWSSDFIDFLRAGTRPVLFGRGELKAGAAWLGEASDAQGEQCNNANPDDEDR
jgi:hypothetical protein